ncbi:MAG: V-type ATP synthase subunit E [Synergistaceae bacterium]|jgi:V/A-type H+-transporting ATPase subunit E|nr:V-type ATP synthase subunit E [Synergistaceae bacterium]
MTEAKGNGGAGTLPGDPIAHDEKYDEKHNEKYDERKKLSELQAMILRKGDRERERILEEARAEAEKWTREQTRHLEEMVGSIKADATKRAYETTSRQLVEAESARDKERLRLQNELVQKALLLLQEALVAFEKRPDYDAILTGVAAEVCGRLPKGQKVKLRLRAEDALRGEPVASALRSRFPDIDMAFDAEPAPIIGGVLLYSEEEKWRVVADWKTKAEEMADAVAKAVIAEL